MSQCPTVAKRMQMRHDTALNWMIANPLLLVGEFAVETDTGKFKIGDGRTRWNDLGYYSGGGGDSDFYNEYLINPPPAPLGLTIDSSNSSQYINVLWQYPAQINAGFLASGWLPDIISFSAQLEGVTYNSLTNQTVVLPTSDSHFINLHSGTRPISVLQLVPYAGTSQYSSGIVVGGTSYPGYIICDPSFSTMTDGAGLIRIWYNNYNLDSGTPTFSATGSPLTFTIAQGAPEQPTNLTAVDSGVAAGGRENETISFTKSSYANSLNHSDTTAVITSYQYTYTLQSTASRYPSALTHTGTVSMAGTVQSQVTPLNPASIYLISLTATNGYGLTCSPVTLTTTQTNFPVAPSATTFTMSSRYYPSVIKISTAGAITNLVLNAYTSWTSSGTFVAPIHTTANRGSTANSLSTLVYSITGAAMAGSPTFPTITYNGFGASPTYTSSGSTTLVTPTVTVADAYANAPSQGFYLVGNNSFAVDLTQTGNFKNANSLYTITTTAGSNTYTSTFYYDQISGPPSSITPTIALGTNTVTKVSGLSVYGSTEAFTIQILASNMGDYFCPSTIANCAVSLYDASVDTTVTGASRALTIANVSGDTISAGAFNYGSTLGAVKISFSDSESLDAYAIAKVFVSGTVYNIVSSATFNSGSTSYVNIVIDQPSLTVLSTLAATLPTVGAGSVAVGRLITSGTSFNATTYAPAWYATNAATSYGEVAYNHTALLTAAGNSELLLANGKFRTFGTSSYYRDYTAYSGPDYSAIAHTSADLRFITFGWKVDFGTGISFNKIAFSFNNAKAGSLSFDANNQTAYITGTSVYPLIYYRMEHQNYTGTDYRIPIGSGTIGNGSMNYTTDWINMNGISVTSVNRSNYNILSSTAGTPFVKSGFNGVSTTSNGDGTVTYTFTPLMGYSDVITASTYVYCRIALPMNVDFEFASVSANLYSVG